MGGGNASPEPPGEISKEAGGAEPPPLLLSSSPLRPPGAAGRHAGRTTSQRLMFPAAGDLQELRDASGIHELLLQLTSDL